MILFNVVLSLIIAIIIYFVILLITKKLLYIFTKYEYETYYLLFPTLLILGIWSLIFIIWYITLTFLLNIDLTSIIIKIVVKDYIDITSILNCSILCILSALIINGLSILTVNIDYKKITGNTRFFFKKLFKTKLKKDKKLIIKNDPEKITFLTGLLISILSFVILVLSISILFFVGFFISNKMA